MEQERVYEAAREILKGIEDIPVGRLTIGEALFLFRNCLRSTEYGLQTVSSFNEKDLQELLTIASALARRGGPFTTH